MKLLRPLAEQGDAGAEYNLGVMYGKGQGVQKDLAEAVKWYRLAAAQGVGAAQSNLGQLYANGQGVSQDYVEAAKWLPRACGADRNVGAGWAKTACRPRTGGASRRSIGRVVLPSVTFSQRTVGFWRLRKKTDDLHWRIP